MGWMRLLRSAASRDLLEPSGDSCHGGLSRIGPDPDDQPSRLDTWLIGLTYRAIAAESRCERCGGHLGRQLRVVASPGDTDGMSYILVVGKCRGRKRHLNVASVVVKDGLDIQLEPFRPISPQRQAGQSGAWW
jgi:hypothetical protein